MAALRPVVAVVVGRSLADAGQDLHPNRRNGCGRDARGADPLQARLHATVEVSPPARVGVLALQGHTPEHLAALREAGADAITARRRPEPDIAPALVIPGGESTTM